MKIIISPSIRIGDSVRYENNWHKVEDKGSIGVMLQNGTEINFGQEVQGRKRADAYRGLRIENS